MSRFPGHKGWTRHLGKSIGKSQLDRAEHVAFDLEIQTSAGAFDDCIRVSETSPLEPGHESIKVYCPHVGLISDGDLILPAVYESEEGKRVPDAPMR